MASFKDKSILVVDDESDLREIVASELDFMGAKVLQAGNVAEATALIKNSKVDVIISDIRMPGGSGIELLNFVKAQRPDIPFILFTGYADITIEDAYDQGSEALIYKPFMLDDIISLVTKYTLPESGRFQSEFHPDKSLELIIPPDKVFFGRGGISLQIKLDENRIGVGDKLQLQLDIGSKHFSGQGICRWLKSTGSSAIGYIGIELINLQEKEFEMFKSFNQGKENIPFIPKH